jgi:menaquinone-dependent protoporphyrinogen oxidase
MGAFAGAMDLNQLSLVYRFMINAMKVPEGDYRDWNAIRAWATDVGPMLLNA